MARYVYQSYLAMADELEAQLKMVTLYRNITAQVGDMTGVGVIYGLLMGEVGDEAPFLLGPLDTETTLSKSLSE